MSTGTTTTTVRLYNPVHQVHEIRAKEKGLETAAYMQRVLTEHAMSSGLMAPEDYSLVEMREWCLNWAVEKAREIDAAGKFTEHLILDVIRSGMEDAEFRANYEKAIGGDAYKKLPGKNPLNPNLGSYIKNAVGAHTARDEEGKPIRERVVNEPVQSYTLLSK